MTLCELMGGVSALVRGTDREEIGPLLVPYRPVQEYALHEVISGPSTHQARLRLQLENGEPKCANCKAWSRIGEYGAIGICGKAMVVHPVHSSSTTTDLSVCSRWEHAGFVHLAEENR